MKSNLTDDLNIYITSYKSIIIKIVNEFNYITNDTSDKTNLENREIFISEANESTIQKYIEDLFPLFKDVLVSYNDYLKDSKYIDAFKTYFRFYKKYPLVFSFISPKLIGTEFFELKDTTEDNYWNYDMFNMVSKSKDILNITSVNNKELPIYELICICLLSSKDLPEGAPTEGEVKDIEPIEPKKDEDKRTSEKYDKDEKYNQSSTDEDYYNDDDSYDKDDDDLFRGEEGPYKDEGDRY